ncbi:MAG: methyltransferase, partial [Myxococcota bacterium]
RDVLDAAHELGILEALGGPPVTLGELAERFGFVPGRLFKFFDCLESLGLVERDQPEDSFESASFRLRDGVLSACRAVLDDGSQERDREKFAWHDIHGQLPAVLRGEHSIAPSAFQWPIETEAQLADFEASMAVGIGPMLESFRQPRIYDVLQRRQRILDVGGGNGALAAGLLEIHEKLAIDVYNVPDARALVQATASNRGLQDRLGFVGGDFLKEALPAGYDAMCFVRTLHDWPADVSRELLRKAFDSLKADGVILIAEEFRNPERLAAQFFWTYFLTGVDSCVSRLREVEFYLGALDRQGFRELSCVAGGPYEIVLGFR